MLREISVSSEIKLPQPEIVHDEKLDEVLQAYIATLADRYAFSVEIKVDENLVLQHLAEFWPEDAEWSAQAYDVWKRIDELVHSVAAITHGPDAMLHVVASPSPLKPAELPQHKGTVAIATFDGVQGVLHHCLLQNGEEPLRSLEALSVQSGLMVICYPALEATEKIVDNRDVGLGSGDNIYSERSRDKHVRPEQQHVAEEKAASPPAEPPRPAPPPQP